MKQRWMFFLEFPCFLYDPENVDNLISGSSAFSKPSLYIWKFFVHVQLKPSLKDIELHLTSTRVFLGGSDDRESDSKVGNLSSGPWLLTLVFLPGETHKQRSLVGYSPWGCQESHTTEQLILYFHLLACEMSTIVW